jgi:type II secretory pathway pseudopilin PulG
MKSRAVKTIRRFTLIELLVAMGVLVIILGFILQFFVGAQKVWTSMEQRNNIYADARVAMDIMTTMLQNTFYSDGGIPIRVNFDTAGKSKVYFATRSMQNLPGGPLKYVTFQRSSTTGEEDQLKIAVFCDKEKDFGYYFPPYGLEGVTDLATAKTTVFDKLDTYLGKSDSPYGSVLLRRVTSFDVIPYKQKDSAPGIDSVTSPYDEVPFMVVLKLTMLSPADYRIWKQMSGTDDGVNGKVETTDNDRVKFRKTHAYTFSRTVYLGEQSRLNIN